MALRHRSEALVTAGADPEQTLAAQSMDKDALVGIV